jgi:hypothetical protein
LAVSNEAASALSEETPYQTRILGPAFGSNCVSARRFFLKPSSFSP